MPSLSRWKGLLLGLLTMKLNYFLICKMCFSVTYFFSSYCRSLILILRSLSRTGFFHLSSLYFGRFLHSATLISKLNTTNTRNKAWTSFIVRSSKNKAFMEKKGLFLRKKYTSYIRGEGNQKLTHKSKSGYCLSLWLCGKKNQKFYLD